MLHMGFTGTQTGMTLEQREVLQEVLQRGKDYFAVRWLHHGDCIGADEQAHEIAGTVGLDRVIHPPKDPKKRAFVKGERSRNPKTYQSRNWDIVKASQILIATPREFEEELHSGTWMTIRMARKAEVDHMIIWPNGIIEMSWINPNQSKEVM